jgi:hypothetical protein
LEYRSTLDTVLAHSEFFEYQWRDVAELARRSMSQQNEALEDYGLELVSRMTVIDSEDQADLVHLAIKLARQSRSSSPKAAELLQAIRDRVSQTSAAEELKAFLEETS